MPLAPATPIAIRLESPRYIVRTLAPADATEAWGSWLADPVAARNLNAKPGRLTLDQVRAYIAGFDRISAHPLGIFVKDTGALIGMRAYYVDWPRGEFLVNIIVGESDARNQGAQRETRTVVLRYFFEDLGLTAARCSVVSTNAGVLRIMQRNGWLHEHVSRKPAADGNGAVELHHFRLPRDIWKKKFDEDGI